MDDRFRDLKEATAAALLRSPGATAPELRQSVARGDPPEELRSLVAKIQLHAYKVTEADWTALRAKYSEDQLFEIVVAAAYGAADSRLTAGLRALELA
jgi:hypothetical protein